MGASSIGSVMDGAMPVNGLISRLAFAAGLLVACQRQPARIYTDKEIAELEARVLAKVAETDASCSKPELLVLTNIFDPDCFSAFMTTKIGADAESQEVAKLDELCGPKTVEAFGRAALGSPSCSPYQVGVRGDAPFVATPSERTRGRLAPLHLAKLLSYHALREVDPYVGITELLIGLRVSQDLARGRINLIQLMLATAMENFVVDAAEKLLARSSLTKEQLDDVAATLDAAIESEPRLGDALQGEALSLALHYGVAGLKPKDWQPPGGRGDLTWSNEERAKTEHHDWRDDPAQMMDMGLRRAETYAKACPSNASIATCVANLPDVPELPDVDLHATDKHAARVAVFPDDDTRHDSQRQLVQDDGHEPVMREYFQGRASTVSRLIALRLRVQVLRDGNCPSETQLAAPPYSIMSAPAVLGDSVRITRTEDALLVEAPAWVTVRERQAPGPPFPPPVKRPKREPVTISCP
jgi:hypothetical protein